ncbi:DUF6431 domain-containing protein [Streptacidiphilus griseoplanus]|uniref:DUF6431 domain-containing protein n=1 Tax=Peterkaempfera griseoplana TaxID=66896 RepID=UPI0006E19080|nr:DUF6431 domain-containing protein [Peterkaempfera griseoplana]
MLIMDMDPVGVELLLSQGQLACPGYARPLAGWGHARPRRIRDRFGAVLPLRPRRARCPACATTHVLLPEAVLPRRADAAEVVGAGLEIAAGGWGHRRIAAELGRPADTVRGWVRRLGTRAETVRSLFTTVMVALADDPVPPSPAGSGMADAVVAVVAAAEAARRRWGQQGLLTWRFACRVSCGALLAPAADPG